MQSGGNKLCTVMSALGQLNILDISTGEVKGFRFKDTPGFDYLKTNKGPFIYYYANACSGRDYIYALYCNREVPRGKGIPRADRLQEKASQIAYDDDVLITCNDDTGEVFYYPLS